MRGRSLAPFFVDFFGSSTIGVATSGFLLSFLETSTGAGASTFAFALGVVSTFTVFFSAAVTAAFVTGFTGALVAGFSTFLAGVLATGFLTIAFFGNGFETFFTGALSGFFATTGLLDFFATTIGALLGFFSGAFLALTFFAGSFFVLALTEAFAELVLATGLLDFCDAFLIPIYVIILSC